ncbi:MAG: beta-N-acetylhexosaminidase, partial [Sinobacteraceae bacterium]|nr:beta-N-acetylhexosaminidase [Nevskiaceae bacterium]
MTIVPAAASAPGPDVIPAPAHVEMASGTFTVRDGMALAMPTEPAAARAAVFLVDLLRATLGIRLKPLGADASDAAAPLRFRLLGGSRDPESYAIDISPQQVTISAADARGLLYGAVTLWQLCTADKAISHPVTLQAMRLTDGPRFKWRGLLLDSARHYQSPAFIMQLLDWMALHKLNVLHWHLTDDQAWRLQIKKYPRLTTVGAWRVPAGAAAAADIDPATHRPRLYGGFYSQQVVRGIVAHAAERNITLVPEIEMPGHATAALVAYPQLATAQHAPASVPSDWGTYPNLYNAQEATFRFLEDVLTEVMALFPSRYIHIGGDEALKDQWNASARIHWRLQELGLADTAALQGYFVSRMSRFLAAHGRRVIGWDEILAAQLPPQAAIMSWRGVQGGLSAAGAGHEVVLAPAPQLYFDNRQGDLPDEPAGHGRIVSVEEVYRFEPLPQALAALQPHVLGVQANIWTEHMRTEEDLQTMLFPRAAALAEMG